MTSEAPYAAFAEGETGQIRAGLAAEFVVLGVDLLKASPALIRAATVRQSWVDGRRLK